MLIVSVYQNIIFIVSFFHFRSFPLFTASVVQYISFRAAAQAQAKKRAADAALPDADFTPPRP